jgi:hypothetical protein
MYEKTHILCRSRSISLLNCAYPFYDPNLFFRQPVKLVDQGVYQAVEGFGLALVSGLLVQSLMAWRRKSIYTCKSIEHIDLWYRRRIMAENEMRNFALRDKDGNEISVFTGKQPRQAALKAANRGHTDIRLRERGTKKVHIFTGERKQVKKPKSTPAWMPDKIWKPIVKKVGVEKLE